MIMRGNTVSILLSDDLRAFVERQAANAGYADVSEYVAAVLRELRDSQQPTTVDRTAVAAALAELDALSVGNRLEGHSIRELIDEGRRL